MMLTSLKKMSLKIFERFCEHDLNQRKKKKKFVYYTTLTIVFNTKTSKFEIKTTSSFKFHFNDLLKSFFR